MKLLFLSLAVISFYGLPLSVRAQSAGPKNSDAAPPAELTNRPSDFDTKTPAQLFEEANNYARKKFEAFQKLKMPYDATLRQKVEREQRDLAVKYAAILSSRKLNGSEVYYLGLLYNLAGKSDEACKAMQRFLTENPNATGEPAQNARAIVVIHEAKRGALAEAEIPMKDYAGNQPQVPEDRYALENWMTVGYFNAKDYEHALPHAEQLWAAARIAAKTKPALARDAMLNDAAISLSEIDLKLGKKNEGIAVVQELRSLALRLPSGNLYKLALRRLIQIDATIDLFKNVEQLASSSAATAPEITATEWIDRLPAKLADLRGQVVLLDFWATWCGPCRATMPRLEKTYRTYKDKGLVIIGLTDFEGRKEDRPVTQTQELEYLRNFKKTFGVTYGFAVSAKEQNNLNYGVTSIPTTFLIDRRGRVRFISVGSSDVEGVALNRMIKNLIDEPAPAISDN